jgi:hypothetical protein
MTLHASDSTQLRGVESTSFDVDFAIMFSGIKKIISQSSRLMKHSAVVGQRETERSCI